MEPLQEVAMGSLTPHTTYYKKVIQGVTTGSYYRELLHGVTTWSHYRKLLQGLVWKCNYSSHYKE